MTSLYRGTGGHNYIQDEDNEDTTHQNHIEEIVDSVMNLQHAPTGKWLLSKEEIVQILTTYGDQRAEEGFKEGYEAGKKDIFKMNGVQPLSTPPNTTEHDKYDCDECEQHMADYLDTHPKNPEELTNNQ